MDNEIMCSTSITTWIAYIWSKQMKEKNKDETNEIVN